MTTEQRYISFLDNEQEGFENEIEINTDYMGLHVTVTNADPDDTISPHRAYFTIKPSQAHMLREFLNRYLEGK